MNKYITLFIGLLLVGSGIIFWKYYYSDNNSYLPNPDTNIPSTSATGTPAGNSSTFTAAQVASHNNSSSCYSIIDGNVYDLTNWINKHPGGQQAILGLCGKDGTVAFHNQHDDAKRQADILATMKIGTLAK